MKKYSLLLLLLFSIIISCKKEKLDSHSVQSVSVENNTAILIGDNIGVNSESIEKLRKSGPVILENPSGNFEVDSFYITRGSSSSYYIILILPVKNISDRAHDRVSLMGIQFLDINDNVIFEDSTFNFISVVRGNSAGYIDGHDISSSAFLRPDDSGNITIFSYNVNFDLVEKIRIDSFYFLNNHYLEYSTTQVIPTDYQVKDGKIYVDITNNSYQYINIDIVEYLLLDDNNKPLFWGYLDVSPGNKTSLGYNGITTFEVENLYHGTCNRIQPILHVSIN